MPEAVTPEWVKHAIFYQIFPDRFARSTQLQKPNNLEPWDADPSPFAYKGGDLLGVAERLDYLQDLGVTALYFNPIFQSASNHRYHTHDYYRVDPLLGGDAAFNQMLAACKQRDIRIVLDGVFNHASRGFFQFNDVLENGEGSPYIDWFHFEDQHPVNAYNHEEPPGYRGWVGLHALPKLNTDNPHVREFLMGIGEYWMRKGIDGWRLDVPTEVTTEGFWEEFRERIKRINPDAYIVGEIWEEAPEYLHGDRFDAVMNYRYTEAAIAYTVGDRVHPDKTIQDRGYRPYPRITGAEYADRIDHLLALYPWQVQLAQLNLLDSHDTARFRTIAEDDEAGVRLGTLLLFTFPGAPSIYYGDEIGLTGGLPDWWARRSFPWNRQETWNTDALAFHKQLIALRRGQPALRTGEYHRLYADDATYAFARSLPGVTLVVVTNTAEQPATVRIPLAGLSIRRTNPTVLYGPGVPTDLAAESLTVRLPARTGTVLDLSPDTATVQ